MPSPSKSKVEFTRQEVMDRLDQWERIDAAVEGEEAVKALGDKILPRPNAEDNSLENQARFNAYLLRAVWFGVSGRTLAGLTGYVFQKEPVVKLPATLKTIETNVDGTGVTLNQQAKEALRLILGKGRAGLLVDYPIVDGSTTRQQLLDGNVAPTIVLYEPKNIINWRTSFKGSKMLLDLLVLRESHVTEDEDDEFKLEENIQYRVLTREENGGVIVRIFRQEADGGEFEEAEKFEPKDKSGKPLAEIPFTFLGVVNNDPFVDTPPLLDLVNLNFAHFRNSADYEESCFMVGQPTPWVAGLTQGWVNDVLKKEVRLGSRAILPLPEGGTAGLLQAEPNIMPMEAMKHKEEQMIRIGAKLISPDAAAQPKTATESMIDHGSEVSVLTSAATNMFLGYKVALAFCGQFVGQDTASIEFDLTEPLSQANMTPEEATSVMATWQGGLIDFEEARWALKKGGLAWKDDDVVQELVANEGLPANPDDPANPGAKKKPAPAADPKPTTPPSPKPTA